MVVGLTAAMFGLVVVLLIPKGNLQETVGLVAAVWPATDVTRVARSGMAPEGSPATFPCTSLQDSPAVRPVAAPSTLSEICQQYL